MKQPLPIITVLLSLSMLGGCSSIGNDVVRPALDLETQTQSIPTAPVVTANPANPGQMAASQPMPRAPQNAITPVSPVHDKPDGAILSLAEEEELHARQKRP